MSIALLIMRDTIIIIQWHYLPVRGINIVGVQNPTPSDGRLENPTPTDGHGFNIHLYQYILYIFFFKLQIQ